jgi:uncharacterized DUF497 family protein
LIYGHFLYKILERFYRYEWDEAKNVGNIRKHRGLSLPYGKRIFSDHKRIIREDMRFDYGERRYIAIGIVDGVILAVCFTPRGFLKRRLISVRIANKKERRFYYEREVYRYDR